MQGVLRAAGAALLLVVMVAAGLAGGAYLYARQTLNAIAAHSPQVRQAQKILQAVPPPSQPAIALIAGYDQRMGVENSGYAGANSDTLMLLRADPKNDTLSLLSFPRDLVVPIYCNGETVVAHNRINAAWGICGGPKGTLDTIEHLTGLGVNYLVTIDFHGFKLLVNRLHGVYMNVDQRYYNPPHDGWASIDLEPGYQKLDGQQALDYVRYRHTDSDLYRLARQQLFIQALKSRLAHNLSLTQLPQVIDAIKGSVEIGRGGGGAPTMSEVESYASLLYHLPPGHLLRNSIDTAQLQPYGPSGAELVAPPAALSDAVSAFLHPRLPSSPRTRASATAGAAVARLPPGRISTLVLNGGEVTGRAAATSSLLAGLGYQTASLPASTPANAPTPAVDTTVYYDPLKPIASRAARQLAPLFGSAVQSEPFSPAIASLARQAGDPLTVVAFGSSFDGALATPNVRTIASARPSRADSAAVEPAPAGIAQALSRTSQAPFPLDAPAQISAGSQLSSLEGVRAYTPAPGRHSTVLTFDMPAGNVYWQIEETTWNSAPILADPTGHLSAGGRRYDLYTTGGHLHMIVLRTARASYWVVNSLLDNLSDPTMLAIAKSMRPLAAG